jgi:hypothetical protein
MFLLPLPVSGEALNFRTRAVTMDINREIITLYRHFAYATHM